MSRLDQSLALDAEAPLAIEHARVLSSLHSALLCLDMATRDEDEVISLRARALLEAAREIQRGAVGEEGSP